MKEKINSNQIVAQHIHYSGPLPPSKEFENYNRVLPGAAERILVMAEKQQAERLSIITQAQKNEHEEFIEYFKSNRRNIYIIAFIISSCMFISAYLIVKDHSIAGSIFAMPSIMALIKYIFIPYPQNSQKKFDSNKSDLLK